MFKDQVAVVTGASSGIGKAIALQLAAQGAKLYLLGRNLETLAATAQNIQTDVKICQVDLTKSAEIRQLKTFVGQVDLLVHSAGVISLGELQTAPVEDLDWQYQTNVRAPYLLTQTLLPLMIPVKGQIVFINSTGGLNSRGGMGQYSATKHALKAIADSLRDEINHLGMRVLSVYPGRTASPMQAAVYEKEGKVYNPDRLLQPQDVADVVLNALSLPRTAEVTDISVRPLVKG
ncbi:MAG: SDR family oxidoreductase [Nostocaceae cyanobacterium]|nr:SDR family oxidoreductase [Nostocaceae cyanobacterium]